MRSPPFRLASIGVTETFGVLNSTWLDNVNVRSPPMTATFVLSLNRYEAPASKNVLSISASPVNRHRQRPLQREVRFGREPDEVQVAEDAEAILLGFKVETEGGRRDCRPHRRRS